MLKFYQTVFALLCLTATTTQCMNLDLDLVIIPGQNGSGGKSAATHLSNFVKETKKVDTPLTTPLIDFGQNICMKYLKNALSNRTNPNNDYILVGASQGGATALNFAANNHNNKIKAIILEAPMTSGNDAINYTLDNHSSCFFPHLAKLIYPFYSPTKMQPLFNQYDTLDKNLPIIILHSKNERCLPHITSTAFYEHLKSLNFKNVYFITIPGNLHIDLINKNNINIIKTILTYHQVITLDSVADNQNINTKIDDYRNINDTQISSKMHLEKLKNTQKNIHRFDWFVKIAIISLLIYNFKDKNLGDLSLDLSLIKDILMIFYGVSYLAF